MLFGDHTSIPAVHHIFNTEHTVQRLGVCPMESQRRGLSIRSFNPGLHVTRKISFQHSGCHANQLHVTCMAGSCQSELADAELEM